MYLDWVSAERVITKGWQWIVALPASSCPYEGKGKKICYYYLSIESWLIILGWYIWLIYIYIYISEVFFGNDFFLIHTVSTSWRWWIVSSVARYVILEGSQARQLAYKKAIIRDLAHDRIWAPVAEFKSRFSDHWTRNPRRHKKICYIISLKMLLYICP